MEALGVPLVMLITFVNNVRLQRDRQMWEFTVVSMCYKKSEMTASVTIPNLFPSVHIANLPSKQN